MKVTVWFDDISIDKAFIVDKVDKMGNSETLQVFEDFISAINWGRAFAKEQKINFEDLTQKW